MKSALEGKFVKHAEKKKMKIRVSESAKSIGRQRSNNNTPTAAASLGGDVKSERFSRNYLRLRVKMASQEG